MQIDRIAHWAALRMAAFDILEEDAFPLVDTNAAFTHCFVKNYALFAINHIMDRPCCDALIAGFLEELETWKLRCLHDELECL